MYPVYEKKKTGWEDATGHVDIWDGNEALDYKYTECDNIYMGTKIIPVMRIVIAVLIIVFISMTSICSQSNGVLTRFSLSMEMEPYTSGYKDTFGKIVIPASKYRYCFTEVFDKIAIVGCRAPGDTENKYYAINRAEDILFEVAAWDNGPDEVQNGLFRILMDGKMGFANMEGHIVIQPAFSTTFPFSEGFAAFCIGGVNVQEREYVVTKGGQWGFVDTTGRIAIPAQFDQVRSFSNGRAMVVKKGVHCEIDTTGTIIP